MDYGHTGDVEESDIELARIAQAGVKAGANDHMLARETLDAPPPLYDSSAPLLDTLVPNGDDGEPSQRQATSSSEEDPPPPLTWVGVVVFTLCVLPILLIIGWLVAVDMERDSLGFSFLALLLLFLSLPVSFSLIACLVRVSTSYIVESCPPPRELGRDS
jgi:hypothetical protein